MKSTFRFRVALWALASLMLVAAPAMAQSDQDAIAIARSVIKADRQAVVTETMQLTEAESQAFWPLYHRYRAEMDKAGDRLVKLVEDYAGCYPDVPEVRAKKMLKELLSLEKEKSTIRAAYLKKFGKVLPADKTLRFAQVENRLDLAVELKLASEIPLVPIEGRLGGESSVATARVEGVPGGTVVQTYELTATVAAIDPGTRRVTLVDASGIKTTLKAGPGVSNVDQIQVGDRLQVTATEELVAYVAGPGEPTSDAAARLVALAPKGAEPGGIMADTTQLTATVVALDIANRKATLQFGDGTKRTVAVRDDVDLSRRKVGDKVIIRTTQSLAIRMVRQ